MKQRVTFLKRFIRIMEATGRQGHITIGELRQQFEEINDETFEKLVNWMEAGGFIEKQGISLVWKGYYQVSPGNWAFFSFDGV